MTKVHLNAFDPVAFQAKAGIGRMIVQLKEKEDFFAQGDKATVSFTFRKVRQS